MVHDSGHVPRSGERYVHVTGAIIQRVVFEASDAESGAFLVFAAYFKMRRQQVAASSNGQDAVLSRLRWEFDSPRCYQVFVCVKE